MTTVTTAPTFRVDHGALVGDNGRIKIEFDLETGGIRKLQNSLTGHVLVEGERPAPWRMLAQGGAGRLLASFNPPGYRTRDPQPSGFEYVVASDGTSVDLRWTTDHPGLDVYVRADLAVEGDLELWPRVSAEPNVIPPLSFTYPLLLSPRSLAKESRNDALAFPGHSGWLIRRPLETDPLEANYPDGYIGASIQMQAYYEDGAGGFYIASHDPASTAKRLRFSAKEVSIDHFAWDVRRGASLDLDYPIVIAPLVIGDWYEAVDRYRRWALVEAPWSKDRLPNSVDPAKDGARWLFEEVGLNVWCAPSSVDWSPWYRFYAEVAQTPLHITPGWDWPVKLPPSLGEEGVFPANFHPANVASWKGHRVTPYLNDLFISGRAPRFLEDWEPNVLLPYITFPWTPFSEPPARWVDGETEGQEPLTTTNLDFFMCPTTDAQVELHAWRDLKLAEDYDLDGVFYDISSGNPWPWSRCLRVEHGHPPGRGRQIIEAYETMNRISKEVVAEATGRYYAQGVETIIENVIGSFDFYNSRACAGPVGVLETWQFGPEEPYGGNRELIPLFQAVYHDVGPVHEDGWLTLNKAEGSVFFWVAARIALQWGGILSLQYSTVPPEKLAGVDRPPETVLWNGATHRWDELPEADPAKIAFVRELGKARTTFARPFLSYGRMMRPASLKLASIELDFHQEFYGWGADGLRNEGIWTAPEVIHSAWQDQDRRLGLVFVNLRHDAPVTLPLRADINAMWELELAGQDVIRQTLEERAKCGHVSTNNTIEFDVTLQPRQVTLIQLG